MALQLHYAALAAFAGLMLVAAFEDLRRFIIPNALTLSVCALWPLYFAASPSLYGGLGALGCALAVFLAGAVCFARGWLGGGDVKLLGAVAVAMPPLAVPTFIAAVAMAGGVLSLVYLALGRLLRVVRRRPLAQPPLAQPPLGQPIGRTVNLLSRAWRLERRRLSRGGPLPYAVAIAAGGMFIFL